MRHLRHFFLALALAQAACSSMGSSESALSSDAASGAPGGAGGTSSGQAGSSAGGSTSKGGSGTGTGGSSAGGTTGSGGAAGSMASAGKAQGGSSGAGGSVGQGGTGQGGSSSGGKGGAAQGGGGGQGGQATGGSAQGGTSQGGSAQGGSAQGGSAAGGEAGAAQGGSAGIFCGNGFVDGPEQCDGGDLAGQSCAALGFVEGALGCTASCVLDTSQCKGERDCQDGVDLDLSGEADCADASCAEQCKNPCLSSPTLRLGETYQGLTTGHARAFDPACAAGPATGPDVAYTFTAAAKGLLRVLVVPQGFDAVLSMRGKCGGGVLDVACSDQAGPGGAEQLAVPLEQGEQVAIVVGGADEGQEGAFSIEATLEVPSCGNGALEPGEECDDGGQIGGDGCNEACQIEACLGAEVLTGEVSVEGDTTGQSAVIVPSCGQVGASAPERLYKYQAPQNGLLEIELVSSASADLTLSLRRSCQPQGDEVACVDGSKAGIERLYTTVLSGETFHVVVDGYDSAQAGPYQLSMRTVAVLCGDGVVAGPEQCDPAAGGPSCTDDCVLPLPQGAPAEVEPNGSAAQATPIDAQTKLVGSVLPAGDVDVFAIDVPQGKRLKVTTSDFEGGNGACLSPLAGPHLDSHLTVLGPDAVTIIASNDDGSSACATLTTAPLGAGLYFIVVQASPTHAPGAVLSYEIAASLE